MRLESGNPGDVAFDPSVISADSNPTQRITFTKKILPTLEVIVSQNLRDSGQITWIVGWQPVPRFELRFVQLDDLDRSYEIRHDVSFGGGTASARAPCAASPENVRDVYVAIFGDVTEEEVRTKLRITEGRKFDFYKWQQDRDRLQELFIERGYYEARITARRDPSTPPQKPTSSTPVDLGTRSTPAAAPRSKSPASPSRTRSARRSCRPGRTRRSTRCSRDEFDAADQAVARERWIPAGVGLDG